MLMELVDVGNVVGVQQVSNCLEYVACNMSHTIDSCRSACSAIFPTHQGVLGIMSSVVLIVLR